MRKLFNYKKLVISLIGSNIYLQMKVEEAISAANSAEYQARRAYGEARDAVGYAIDASDYAEEASENARKAYYSAQNASSNSFGNQCWSCP